MLLRFSPSRTHLLVSQRSQGFIRRAESSASARRRAQLCLGHSLVCNDARAGDVPHTRSPASHQQPHGCDKSGNAEPATYRNFMQLLMNHVETYDVTASRTSQFHCRFLHSSREVAGLRLSLSQFLQNSRFCFSELIFPFTVFIVYVHTVFRH